MSTRDYTTSHSAAPTYHAISSAEVSQARAASINATANTTPHSTKRNSLNLSLGRRKIQITWQLHHRKRRPPCLKLLAVLHLHVRVLPRRNPIGLNGSPRGQERRESAERRRGCQSISVIPVQRFVSPYHFLDIHANATSSSHATKGSSMVPPPPNHPCDMIPR